MGISSINEFKDNLQLIFIPFEYWNNSFSSFSLVSTEKELPHETNFFLLWCNSAQSEQELLNKIISVFPEIPADKLVSCKIMLALPEEQGLYNISPVLGKIIPIPPAINLLYKLQIIESQDRNINLHFSNSIKTWAVLTKFIFELLNRGNFVPTLEQKSEKEYIAQWRLLLKSNQDNDRFNFILNNSPLTSYNIPINFIERIDKDTKQISYVTDGLWHPSYLFSKYLDSVGDIAIRAILKKEKFQAFNDFYSSEIKQEGNRDFGLSWDYKFLKSLITEEKVFKINKFHETIIPSIINDWIQITQGTVYNKGFTFVLELKYPEDPNDDWLLDFSLVLQNNEGYSLKDVFENNSEVKRELLKFYEKEEQFLEAILRSLGTAAKIFPPINRAFELKIPYNVALKSSEVLEFLKYPKDILIQSGFNIILPEAFIRGGKHCLSARLIIRSKKRKEKGISSKFSSLFDLNSMLEYEWEGTLEGEKLSDEEFKKLIESDEPLVNWRNSWILIDQKEVEDLRTLLQKNAIKGNLNYIEAMKLGLTGNVQLQEHGNNYEVVIEGGFNDIIEKLKSFERFDEISTPSSFKGNLRPYQEIGITWMANMIDFNLGLCLADDMGLGKTIQIIAVLLYLKQNQPELSSGSYLVICPMSVLFNWIRELKKFGPSLEIILHHGPERVKDVSKISEYLKPHLIVLTSYGTLRNDIDLLSTIPFKGIILDEIQNIKNYSSKQTQAIYKLQSQFRIGLSGTPIENRLMELWALFEFLNPGLLDTRTEFQRNFILPIARFQDQDVINKLKKILTPFILRRVKSDKSIISDLPEKNEIKIYVELSETQARLYKELVEEALKDIKSNISDKINVLNLLVKLKQLCNHPFQFLHKEAPSFNNKKELKEFLAQSRKLERIIEMIDEVISNGEKLLIFTQFTKMAEIIKKILEFKYNFEILYFHGGVPEKKRKEIVDSFQSKDIESPPILILSLKAGGIGLNLTSATTVFHFDRSWNPAIENQATDRTYRIGQESRVNVYKFITNRTIEEKIDMLLEEKRELAETILPSSGESWISELTEDKLKELFKLGD